MASIDPALFLAQWQALQRQNLPTTSAIVDPILQPQIQQPIYQQTYQQPAGEFLTDSQLYAIAEYLKASQAASVAAANWIEFLQQQYLQLAQFSAAQDGLINRFLYDRDFAIKYAYDAWLNGSIDRNFATKLANLYLAAEQQFEHRNDPEYVARKESNQAGRNPEFTGSPITFDARLVPQQVPQQIPSSIPPLPTNNGSQSGSIDIQQYWNAVNNGQSAQARLAAMQNPAKLYEALFS